MKGLRFAFKSSTGVKVLADPQHGSELVVFVALALIRRRADDTGGQEVPQSIEPRAMKSLLPLTRVRDSTT